MTIESLMRAVPPPEEPTFAFRGPWGPIEAYIGTELPQDYKDLTRLYGSGLFLDLIKIHDPAGPDPGSSLVIQMHEVLRMFREFHPHIPMYPKPGGLLVCGSSNTGEYIFWLTRGLVSEWPIVVWDHDCAEDEELELLECDLTDFLAGLVTGDVRPRTYSGMEEVEEGEQVFIPTAEI